MAVDEYWTLVCFVKCKKLKSINVEAHVEDEKKYEVQTIGFFRQLLPESR